jgi:predicted NAD/FAD-binding protein
MLPRRRAAWASWNYHLGSGVRDRTALTYWMNNLQQLRSDDDYCVTLNRTKEIDPAKVIATIPYSHPVYTHAGMAAQERHHEISGVDHTHYCGAYWRWGFHEDGVWSAERVTDRIAQAMPA